MKLALISEYWEPEVGGAQNYLANIVDYLDKKGHQMTVVAPKLENRKKKLEKRKLTCRVYRRRFYSRLIRPRWWMLYRWMVRRAGKDQWQVLMCGKGLFEGLIGYRLKKRLGLPYVVLTYAMEIEQWKANWWQRRKLKKVLMSANKVFCINEVTKKSLIELGLAETNIVKAWPGVDKKMFNQVSEEELVSVLKKYEIKRPYIISVGRLVERKGFSDLIEAVGKIDQTKFGDTQLVIVGDGPLLDTLQAQVEGELMDSSVLLLPDVPDTDLPVLYAGAKLFALTPKEVGGDIEGFGIVYLEAAAQGVPAVGTKTGGVPEAVIDGGSGILVEPGNVEAITRALERILGDKSFNVKLGDGARRRTFEEFSWSVRGQIIENELSEII